MKSIYQTMNRKYDVIVVGGGPTGSTAARICAKSGLSTLLVEEQAHIGYPVQCAGLLSNSAFTECEVSDSSVLNIVSGADVLAGKAMCSFDAGRDMAYVVDRGALDHEMITASADAGADIRLKTIASAVSRTSRSLYLKGLYGKEQIEYSMLIAADGPRSSISRMIGIPRAPVYLSGLQCDVACSTPTEHVRIFPNAAPDFFGWMIPIHPERTRIGLCGIHQVQELFQKFIQPYKKACTHFVSGTIPLGTLTRTYDDRILIAGDAAAMAKPTSGGGVYTGIRAARHAARVATEAIEQSDYSIQKMKTYEHSWKADFGHEIRKGFYMYTIRQQVSIQDMERIIEILADPKIREIISKKGDIDRPSHLITSLMQNPLMIPAWYLMGKSLLKSLI
ncbi:NAD(P)/FAD-dependent oxidoreductase [Methanospirillum purgamenti]|jgi:digeranylgeranylglycerophospholipid reductase|nr:NAD(P)/FAD-dependent oxidoreductase [Methanospirillum hungatei]